MPFPHLAIKESGGPIAFMLFQDGTIKPLKIVVIDGRIWRSKYGDFQINMDYRYMYGKASVFFYYVKCPNPLDVFSLAKIWNYLKETSDPILREADLSNMIPIPEDMPKVTRDEKTTLGTVLGFDVLRFLNSLKYTDEEALEHIYDAPMRRDKPLPVSGDVLGLPEVSPKYMGLYVTKDKRIERISMKVKRDGAKVTGKWKTLEFDLSDKTLRYSVGKSSVYVLLEGEKTPINLNVTAYLNDFVAYEPIWVNDDEANIAHTHNMLKLSTRPPPKKTMNVMLVLIGVIGFILVYQSVINPAISKYQTDEQAKQEKADQAKAAAVAHQAQLSNSTKTVGGKVGSTPLDNKPSTQTGGTIPPGGSLTNSSAQQQKPPYDTSVLVRK